VIGVRNRFRGNVANAATFGHGDGVRQAGGSPVLDKLRPVCRVEQIDRALPVKAEPQLNHPGLRGAFRASHRGGQHQDRSAEIALADWLARHQE